MEIIDGLSEIAYEGNTRVAIGKFDGIHAGHQMLIKEMTRHHDDLKSVVFTFSFASEIYLNKNERGNRYESVTRKNGKNEKHD